MIPDTRLIGVSTNLRDVSYGTYLQVKHAVWTERQHELFFEFDRFYDLQRMDLMEEQIRKKNGSLTADYQVKYIHAVHHVFPIPQWEVDISNGVVVQNPGY